MQVTTGRELAHKPPGTDCPIRVEELVRTGRFSDPNRRIRLMKTRIIWLLAAAGLLALGMGPNPRYLEELRVGGGYEDPGDGGADFEKDGSITTSGNVRILDGRSLIVGTAAAVYFGYDQAGEGRAEWSDGANLLMYLTDAGTTGNWGVTGSGDIAGLLHIGGGYGATGTTLDASGNVHSNGNTTVDGQLTIGGGFGNTGITLSGTGAISANGTLTVSNGATYDYILVGTNDTHHGRLALYSSAANSGGRIELYNADNYDNSVNWWQIDADYGSLNIRPQTWAAAFSINQTGEAVFGNNVYIPDDKCLTFGSNGDFRLAYDEAADDKLEITDGAGNLMLSLEKVQGSLGKLTTTAQVHCLGVTCDSLFDLNNEDFYMGTAAGGVVRLNAPAAVPGYLALKLENAAGGVTFSFDPTTTNNGDAVFRLFRYGSINGTGAGRFVIHSPGSATEKFTVVAATGQTAAGDITSQTGQIAAGADSATRGVVTAWDGSGGNAPGCLKLCSPNGTAWYLFVEDDGTLKVHGALPTQNSDGTVVGTQS